MTKKFISGLVGLWLSAAALMYAQPPPVPQTPNLKLNLPPHGTPGWDTYANENFLIIDSQQPQWRGDWVTTTPYSLSQLVLYSGSSYISLASDNVNHQPDTSPTFWQILAGVGGVVVNQSAGVIPLATGSATIAAQSHLDDGNTTLGTITSSEPISGTSAAFAGDVSAAQFFGPLNGNATTATTTATATTATHALNLPADLAAQSAASPNPAAFSTVAAGATAPSGTPGFWGVASQAEINGATYVGKPASGLCSIGDAPCLAVQAACAGSKAVYFPQGTYPTHGVPVCSNLHIRGAGKAVSGSAGTTFVVTGANWGLFNPNADIAIGSGQGVSDLIIESLVIDISTDPLNVLGAIRHKGISHSNYISLSIVSYNNANPAVTEDGANFNHSNGDYDSNFIGVDLYDISGTGLPYIGGSMGVGYYITACSVYTGCAGQLHGGSNDVHHIGGSISRYGYSVLIDGGNNNSFLAIDGENAQQDCVVTQAGASGNLFQRFRCETSLVPWSSGTKSVGAKIVDSNNNYETVSGAGTTGGTQPTWPSTVGATTTDGTVVWTLTTLKPVLIEAQGSTGNLFDILASGYTPEVHDPESQNTYQSGTLFGSSFLPGVLSVTGGSWAYAKQGWSWWGFNKQPWPLDGDPFHGGVGVHGSLQADRQFLLCNFTNGCYSKGGLSFTTTGTGTGALIEVDTISNGTIVTTILTNPGTGFAVGDVLNLTQTSSSGTGAQITVNSITGGGGTGPIGTYTVTNPGAGGYAAMRYTGATGTITFPGPGTVMMTGGVTTNLITSPTNTATAGTNFGSYQIGATGSYWNGSAAAADTVFCYDAPGVGTNPQVSYLCTFSGSPGGHLWQYNNMGMFYFNGTPATAGANSPIPPFTWYQGYWNGTTSAADQWVLTPTLAAGANPPSIMRWTHTGSSGGAYHDFPGIAINGSTPVTSKSSTGSQMVTCPTGGTGTQVCGADGAWHDVAGTNPGTCYKVGTLASPFTLTGTTSVTNAATIAIPALLTNSLMRVHTDVFGNTGNTGNLAVTVTLNASNAATVSGIALANAYEIIDTELRNEGSTSAQMVTWRFVKPLATVTQNVSETAIPTGAGQNLFIKFTPTLGTDTWVLKTADVVVCP